MRWKNLRIGTQLLLGFGIILVFVVFLGIVVWTQTEQAWQQTKELYDHPLAVQKALSEIKADILSIRGGMQEICLMDKDQERLEVIQGLDSLELEVQKEFDVLHDRYPGSKSEIDDFVQTFAQWKPIRTVTIQLLKSGRKAEAIKRVRSTGEDGLHVTETLKKFKILSDSAQARGAEFFSNATESQDTIKWQLGVTLGVILFLSICVITLLLKGINEPMLELVAVTSQYRQGKLDVRSRYASANEPGELATTFNLMADTIKVELQVKDKAAQIADEILQEDDPYIFCQILLKTLLAHTGAQAAAIYLLDSRQTDFELFATIGLGLDTCASFPADPTEQSDSEFGTALATRSIQLIKNIPKNSCFTSAAGSEKFNPCQIITIPILSEQTVVALISLANEHDYSDHAVRLVEICWSLITARLTSVLTFRHLHASSALLKTKSRELEAKLAELNKKNDELEIHDWPPDVRTSSARISTRMKSFRRPFILIVEENADSRQTLAAMVQDRYTVIEAEDGADGIEQAQHYHPDLILMDISMPGMDGHEVLTEIRKDVGLRGIPVVAISAGAINGNREEALAAGFDDFISKPVNAGLLKKTIAKKLER
ncbi:MAG: response regulator [Candidatus Riflebacteria bacterium]|nr:response regulator [Candidatus Riflebacteria bacterium]